MMSDRKIKEGIALVFLIFILGFYTGKAFGRGMYEQATSNVTGELKF